MTPADFARACPDPLFDEEAFTTAEAQRQARLSHWRSQGLAAMPEILRAACERGGTEDARHALLSMGAAAIPELFEESVRGRWVDGCLDVAGGAVEALLRSTGDRRGGQVVLDALRSGRADRILAALSVLNGLTTEDSRKIPARAGAPEGAAAWILERARAPIASLLDDRDEQVRVAVLWTISKTPERYRRQVPRIEDLLDGWRTSNAALAVLVKLSPPTSATVRWLRRQIAGTSDRDRALWLTSRLRDMRPLPVAALPELWRRLRDSHRLSCFVLASHVRTYAGTILAIDPDAARSSAAGFGSMQELAAFASSAVLGAMRCGEHGDSLERVLKILPAAEAEPIWRRVMNDADAEIAVRRFAAKALQRTALPLTTEEQRLRQILALRQRMGQDSYMDVRSEAERLEATLRGCRREAGIAGPSPALVEARTPEEAQAMGRAAECLDTRLCGPEPAAFARAIEVCCAYAFVSPAAWCRDGR